MTLYDICAFIGIFVIALALSGLGLLIGQSFHDWICDEIDRRAREKAQRWLDEQKEQNDGKL